MADRVWENQCRGSDVSLPAAGTTMSSIQNLREFISERLNVAAVEIFAVVERTIVRYAERTERRQEMTGRPRGRFHGAENPQHVCKEEQLWNQETSSSPDQENPEAPGCKEEEEEELKQESDPFVEPPAERGSEHSEELLSHNSVRSFINVRLSAAAVEIFSVFEQTMVQYEEQLDGHPRVLDPTETAHIQPHAAENPQHVCKEEQLWNQETSSSPDQENPEAPGWKEEEEELKQESDPFVEPPAGEEGDCSEAEADPEDQLTDAEDNKLPMLEPIIVWSGSQCSLPENILKPRIKLHRIDCQQQHVCNQERTSILCQEEPAPPQIKEEQEEHWTTVEVGTVSLKQEADDSLLTSRGDESDQSEPQSEFASQEKQLDRIHEDEKPYSCSECHKCFRWKHSLISHKRTHTGEKPYSCSVCQKSFSVGCSLNYHKRTHTGEKPYSCSVCQQRFTSACSLKTHKRTHTGEKPYSCSECHKGFTSADNLKKHKWIHSGEKPYSCSDCSKTFRQRSHLKYHERTHTGEKPYSCSVCQKRFTSGPSLKYHKRTHTGEKPYSCSVCQKRFTSGPNLKIHERTHTGEKPYSCSVCQKRFISAYSLKTHKRTHTGEKPYLCSVCHKGFSSGYNMKIHKETHAGENPY